MGFYSCRSKIATLTIISSGKVGVGKASEFANSSRRQSRALAVPSPRRGLCPGDKGYMSKVNSTLLT